MNVPSDKMKKFSIGTINAPKKGATKKELEEMKRLAEEERQAKVYEEFVAEFNSQQQSSDGDRVWVKGGVVDPGDRNKSSDAGRGALYKPTSKLVPTVKQEKKESQSESKDNWSGSRKKPASSSSSVAVPGRRKRSNLELFKEELKVIQSERDSRRAAKQAMLEAQGISKEETKQLIAANESIQIADFPEARKSRFEPMQPQHGHSHNKPDQFELDNDLMTTNLYMSNLCPKLVENDLCELFGRYGPLASVKIMWPRGEEQQSRQSHCGFVAYMNRKDGERAMARLRGRMVRGFEMRIGWGKAVPIPPHPVYVPPPLQELLQPPAFSGLPFNAQPPSRKKLSLPIKTAHMSRQELDKLLSDSVVKVTIPHDRAQLFVIHRMVEFVIREGPLFEAIIMNREINNPMYSFLFDNQSPAHVYYRWKIFSILQGEPVNKWSPNEFHMFKGGPMWRPPPTNPYINGMPKELIPESDEEEAYWASQGSGAPVPLDSIRLPKRKTSPERTPSSKRKRSRSRDRDDERKKGALSSRQKAHVEQLLKELTAERNSVADAMLWLMQHADCAEEICKLVSRSFHDNDVTPGQLIARLFLVSDVLYNSSCKLPNASFYRKFIQQRLEDIFTCLHLAYTSIDGRLKAEQFKLRVMKVFQAWDEWAVYPNEFLIKLQNILLGLLSRAGDESVPSEARERVERPSTGFDPVGSASRAEPAAAAAAPIFDTGPLGLVGYGAGSDSDQEDDEHLLPSIPAAIKARFRPAAPETRVPPKRGRYAPRDDDDIDGKPLETRPAYDDDVDGVPLAGSGGGGGGSGSFKAAPSKWAQLDPSEVAKQAVSSSKWELFEDPDKPDASGDGQLVAYVVEPQSGDEDDIDGRPLLAPLARLGTDTSAERWLSAGGESEQRRALLRQIEMKAMKLQDELESGRRRGRGGLTVEQEVEEYRRQLLEEAEREGSASDGDARRRRASSGSDSSARSGGRRRRKHRSRSRSKGRRSRDAPERPKRSRSRSPGHRKKHKKSYRE